jgi:hypothetical protein
MRSYPSLNMTLRPQIDGRSLPVSAAICACVLELIASRMQSVISTMLQRNCATVFRRWKRS